MRYTYSLYEAKARFSELVRKVREGSRIVVTLHGEPVVEMRPIAPKGSGLEARLQELAERGILVRPSKRRSRLRPVARKPGALKRFLDDRD